MGFQSILHNIYIQFHDLLVDIQHIHRTNLLRMDFYILCSIYRIIIQGDNLHCIDTQIDGVLLLCSQNDKKV